MKKLSEFYAERNAEILRRIESGEKRKVIAREYGLTDSGIKQILAKVRKQLSAMVTKT